MRNKKLDQLIQQMENYLECWKQFNHFLNLARAKKFGPEDDTQFLEIKSIIVQELELILSSLEVSTPTKEEIHALVGNAPSLRFLSEMKSSSARGGFQIRLCIDVRQEIATTPAACRKKISPSGGAFPSQSCRCFTLAPAIQHPFKRNHD